MLEFPQNIKYRALLVCPVLVSAAQKKSIESRKNEISGLALAIDLDIFDVLVVNLRQIRASLYFSKSHVSNWKNLIEENEIDLLIVDGTLSAIQQRNLEKELQVKVIDRTALILEIFGDRAKTAEGKLQVELAHLTYQRSRLVKSWTHLERQRGGGGFLGGPGEKQKELDRRFLDEKIIKIKKELEKVKNTRSLQREKRQKVPYDVVVLVGYTNTGKSTLFNALTNENVMAEDMLFATLDPTLRKLKLPSGREVILSDTVGFISDLPHELVMSFRATLEEVLEADLIVHVRDISGENQKEERQDVLDVLHHLGLENIEHQSNYIEVLNKIDLFQEEKRENIIKKYDGRLNSALAISAVTKLGMRNLLELMDEKLKQNAKEAVFEVASFDGQKQSLIYKFSHVLGKKISDDGQTIQFFVQAEPHLLEKLQKLLSK